MSEIRSEKPFSLEDDLHLSTTQPSKLEASQDPTPKNTQNVVRKSTRIKNYQETTEPKNSRIQDQIYRYSDCRVVLVDVLKAAQEKKKTLSAQNKLKSFIDQVRAVTTEKNTDTESKTSVQNVIDKDEDRLNIQRTVDFETAIPNRPDDIVTLTSEKDCDSATAAATTATSDENFSEMKQNVFAENVDAFPKLTLSKMEIYFHQDPFTIDSN